MSLSEKYDQFYPTTAEAQAANFLATPIRRWPRNRIEAVVAIPGTGDAVLDIGCGEGDLLYQFRDRYSRLIGLEYAPQRLSQATVNLAGHRFQGIVGSAENMASIPDHSVDRIISADVIEHIPDVYAACDEMLRVLKPGGWLVINTPNVAFLKKRILLLLGRFPSTSQPNEGIGRQVLFDGGHLHYFTYRSLRLVLERSGFEMIRRTGFGRFGAVHQIYLPLTSVGVQWIARKPV